MNHLNSSLLEGVIAEKPEYNEGEKQCTFKMQSNRFYKEKAGIGIKKKENIFTVIVTGKIAEVLSTKKKGTGVRVIGRLDTTQNNAVIIVAEHIEYKLELGKGGS